MFACIGSDSFQQEVSRGLELHVACTTLLLGSAAPYRIMVPILDQGMASIWPPV